MPKIASSAAVAGQVAVVGRNAIIVLIFQIGWLSCVLGAARGQPLLGPVIVISWLGIYSIRSKQSVAMWVPILGAGILGFLFDSSLTRAGIISFPATPWLARLAPPWMVALWMNLAGALNEALGWLAGRYVLAAVLGTVGGPLAYYAGAGLGAIELREPLGSALLLIALEWMIAMPVLVGLADRSRRRAAGKPHSLRPKGGTSEEIT